MKIKNFLFHRVSPEKDLMWPPVHPGEFEKIIGFLVKNYHVVLLENFLEASVLKSINKPVATVLFDDGYKDNFEFAAPILKKYNCPASFYIVTECINEGIPTWTYIVDFFFKEYPKNSLELEYDFIPANLRISKWYSSGQAEELAVRLKTCLKSLPNEQRLGVMEEIKRKLKGIAFPRDLMMNWENVRQLNIAGFYIGSHTHSHPMLASIINEDEIENELRQSACIINEQLGYRPTTISYPIGSWDERVVRIAKNVGYKLGLVVEQRQYDSEQDDKLLIPRIELYNESWWKTKLRMNGIYQSIKRLVR